MKRLLRWGGTTGAVILPLLVAILAVAVGVEGWLLYRVYHRSGSTSNAPSQPPRVETQQAAGMRRAESGPSIAPQVTDPFDVFDAWNWNEWDPFAEMERMREQMDRLFESSLNRFRRSSKTPTAWSFTFSPQMDLSDNGDEYIVRFDLPGIDKSKITVKLEDRVLTVQGATAEERQEEQGGHVIRMERRSGQFSRSVTLPGPVKSEGMKAEYENGVLTVKIPKATHAHEQKIITL